MKLEAATAEQMLLPALPRRGAKDTGERDSLQRLTTMGSRASGSPRRLLSFQLGLRIPFYLTVALSSPSALALTEAA